MKLSEISIQRPVLASMMSLALVLFGSVALTRLPVRELPDIDPPIVSVTTVFPGANAQVVETEVSERLEETINSIEGIKTLTSESREQVSIVTIQFDLSRDIEVAAQDVRDRVSRVRGLLPEEIEEPIVAKQDADASPVIWIALFSDRFSTLELTTIAENQMKDRLQTVKGVSSVFLGGAKRFAMRLRLNAEKMAAHGVTVQDVDDALRRQNVEIPSGRIESLDREMTIQTLGEMKTADEFNRLVIREDGGALVRLQDIGRAEVGVEDERTIARFNSKPAVGLGIVKQSKANTIEVAQGVKQELDKMIPQLPAGVETFIPYDESIFVEQSIHEVWITLFVAFVLVVITIFVFLRNVRSTLIPCLTIPVSIVGTYMVLGIMGYSVNILTMLALVLAIGIVVDDSIVVLENIYRHIEDGMKPMDAALLGMKEIGFAVIAITISLCAVFIPLAFQTTVTGRLFVEFAIALSGSVIISAFIALTLTPMVAARILKPHQESQKHGRVFNSFERAFERLNERYNRMLQWSLGHRTFVVVASLVLFAATAWVFTQLRNEFLPEEDKGRLLVMSITPEGSTSEYTDRMLKRVEGIAKGTPEVDGYFSAVALGFGAPGKANQAFMFMRLKEERERGVLDIVEGPMGMGAQLFGTIEGAMSFPIIPKAVTRGFGQPFQVVLQEQDLGKLNENAQKMVAKLSAAGFLSNVRSSFEVTKPELRVAIDRDRAAAVGVSIEDLASALQVLFGGLDLSKIKLGGKQYDVIAQLDRESRLTPADLDRLYVRNNLGQLIQLSSVVNYSTGAGPTAINHYNRFRSATIEGTPVGVPMGEAMKLTENILRAELPGVRYEWSGEASDLKEAGQGFIFVVVLALIVVYMVLAAQFESLLHPFTIMLTLPLAASGAFGLLWMLSGVDFLGQMFYAMSHYAPNPSAVSRWMGTVVPRIPAMGINLFSQIGLVLLIGLSTKNSILLVEFANQQMAKGKSAREAMQQAGLIRFRPILMTSFSTILGILPIAIGFGAGGESRRPLGVAAIGGLLTGTFLTLLVVPVVYTLFNDLSRRMTRRPHGAAGAAAALLVLLLTVAPSKAGEAYDLPRCLDEALQTNFDILRARERIQEESGAVLEVHSGYLPKATLNAQYEKIDEQLVQSFGPDAPGSSQNWVARVEVVQDIYAGGRTRASVASARKQEESAVAELETVINSVILQVHERYYDVLLARSDIQVQEQNVALLEAELVTASNKLSAGVEAPYSVLRAEVGLANGRTPLIRARNNYRIAIEELRRVLGLAIEDEAGAESPIEVAGEMTMTPMTITLDEASRQSREQRPELRQLETQVASQRYALDAERGGHRPTLQAFGGYGAESSRISDDLTDELHGWVAGGRLNWDLFDAGLTKGRVRQAASRMRQAQLNYADLQQLIDVEVRRAYSTFVEATELVQATRKVVEQAAEGMRLVTSRFDVGAATQLEVLDARVALLIARQNDNLALHDYQVALARLKRAMGTLASQESQGRGDVQTTPDGVTTNTPNS